MNQIKCSCNMPFRPDITGHCSNCGSPPADSTMRDIPTDNLEISAPKTVPDSGEIFTTDPGLKALPIQLEYQHTYCHAGQHGCLPLRFTNRGDDTITQIELNAKCTAFQNYQPVAPFQGLIAPGGDTCQLSLDFDLNSRYGDYLVKVQGAFLDQKKRPTAFRGQFKFKVRNANAPRSKIELNEIYGADLSNIDFDAVDLVMKGGHGIDLSNSQTNIARETGWIEVKLEDDPVVTDTLQRISWQRDAAERRQYPHWEKYHYARGPTALRRCMLSLTDDEDTKRIHIWTPAKCTIGKQPPRADLICVCMPDEGDNKKRNGLISRRHCRLEVKGNRVVLEDLDSTNGTFIDRSRITKSKTLKNRQLIGLANQLNLEYREFRQIDQNRQIKKVFNTCTTMTQCNTALADLDLERIAASAPLECFLLKRNDRFRQKLQYLFLQKAALIGAARNVAVRLKNKTVSDLHARMILDRNKLMIEDLNSAGGTFVDNERLQPYLAKPLNHEARLRIGEVTIDLNQLDF